ncbi:MAG TPA: hypothetical protein VKR38_05990 [Usitatibacter sp.]|nr:hypothetical protein [Usitatibacter sp.]
MKRRLAFFLALLLAAATSLAAQPEETTKVRVYGQVIDIPNPPGLVPLINRDSLYFRFGARLQAASKNQLLASFLPPDEAAIADMGQLPSPVYWSIVYGVAPALNRSMTVAQFQAEVLPEIERSIDAAVTNPELRRRIGEGTDASVAQLGRELKVESGKLRMGEVTPLGIFTKSASYATFGTATRIQVEKGGHVMEAPIITVIGFMVAKERLFCIAVYRIYRDEKDVESAKRDSTAWIEAIARANP